MLGWLGKWAGSKGMGRIPNLVGLTKEQARQALANDGFNVGIESEDSQQNESLTNLVKSQGRPFNELVDYETSVDYIIHVFTFTPYSFTPTTQYSFTPEAYNFTPQYSFTPEAYNFTPQYSFTPQTRECCEGGCTEADIVRIYDSEEVCSEISTCEECSYYGGVNCVIFQIAEYCDGSTQVVGSTQGPNHTGPVREPSGDELCCPGTYTFTPAYSFTPTNSNNCPDPGSWSAWSDCIDGVRTRTRTNYDDIPGCPSYIETETEACTPAYNFTPAYTFTPAYSFTPTATCPDPGSWSSWSTCSNGTQTRTRTNYELVGGNCIPYTEEETQACTPPYNFTPAYTFTPFSFIPQGYNFTPQYSFTPMTPYSFTPETPYSFTPETYTFTPMTYSFTPFSFTPLEGGPV